MYKTIIKRRQAMEKRKNIITFAGGALTLIGKEIKTGDMAPDFTALDSELKPVKLSDFKGKTVLISVFPSIDTGVCASQTRRFNEEAAKRPDVVILNISVDLPFALGRFCAAEGITNSVTVSDHKELDFGNKYGFSIEELRLLSRGIVIVGKDGRVKYVEYVKEITNHPDYSTALNSL